MERPRTGHGKRPQLFEPSFEKEPLRFAAQASDLQEYPAFKSLANEIKDKLAQNGSGILYRWSHVPVVLPPSIIGLDEGADQKEGNGGGGEEKNFKINYADLFMQPTFNELEQLAVDSAGKPKKLSQKQLASIRRSGKFEVDSAHFPGKTHQWALNRIIQKGYDVSNKDFFSAMSFALRLLIVTAKDRFAGSCFSIWNGITTWTSEIVCLFDLLIGLKSMDQVPYETKLKEELHKFLVQELTVDPTDQKKYEELCRQIERALKEKKQLVRINAEVPYFYLTPDKIKIDLRLFDHRLVQRLDPVINEIMKNSEDHLVYLKELRNASVTQLKNDGLSDEEVAKNTLDMLEREYTKRVLGDIKNDQRLERISPGIGQLLCDQYRAVTIVDQACQELSQELAQHLKNYEEKLKKEHRVRSLIHEWVSQRIDEEKRAFIESHQYTAFERSLKSLDSAGLLQYKYLMQRELEFIQQKEPRLIEAYLKEKVPTRQFTFHRAIWSPSNWIITKTENAEDGQVHYSLEKYVQYRNDTSAPFWRWTNYLKRTWVHVSNSIFMLGLVIPFVSPVSFRALLSISPYHANKKLDEHGKLVEDKSSKVLTYASRLKAIWDDVAASRAKFERTPDKGLLGKTVSRFFNRAWNYVIKGAIGTLGLTLIFPPLCISVSTVSLVLGLAAPIWYPILNLVLHLLFVLIFDFDYFGQRTSRRWPYLFPLPSIVFRLLFLGIAQPILALFTAVVLCPLASASTVIIATTLKVLEKFYDDLVYHTVLKRAARIPSNDTFVARRVAGPGLASDYFFQIQPEQALAALEANLEIKILSAYMSQIEQRLNEPIRVYSKYFNTFLRQFSYGLDTSAEPFSGLQNQVSSHISKYRERINKRTAFIDKLKTNANLSKIRLNENDLAVLLAKSTELVEKHFTESILPYKNQTKADLFAEKGINDDDWTTFTGTILEEIFGSGILTPLEETHNYFSLKVDHLNLEKYTRMIADTELRDDLDKVHTVYQPKRGHVPIDLPQSLEIYKFHATAQSNPSYQRDPLSRKRRPQLNSNLTNPTTLPEDACLVAVITHNYQNLEPYIDYTFARVEALQGRWAKAFFSR